MEFGALGFLRLGLCFSVFRFVWQMPPEIRGGEWVSVAGECVAGEVREKKKKKKEKKRKKKELGSRACVR
jgi:hypothetical protein